MIFATTPGHAPSGGATEAPAAAVRGVFVAAARGGNWYLNQKLIQLNWLLQASFAGIWVLQSGCWFWGLPWWERKLSSNTHLKVKDHVGIWNIATSTTVLSRCVHEIVAVGWPFVEMDLLPSSWVTNPIRNWCKQGRVFAESVWEILGGYFSSMRVSRVCPRGSARKFDSRQLSKMFFV